MTRFNYLNVPGDWQQYWTKYPEGYTILEALINWVGQVDDMVDNQNQLNQTVENYGNRLDKFIEQFDDNLRTEVTEVLSEWQQTGFLDVVINEALQTQIDDVEAQLAQTATIVTDFGAIGDGVTDDTLAIQNAIDHQFTNGGGDVLLPRGIFKITTSIVVRKGVVVKGQGYAPNAPSEAKTVILKGGAFDGVLVGNASTLENLSVNGGGYVGDGVVVTAGRSKVEKVSSFNNGGNGLTIANGANLWRLQDIGTISNVGHGLNIKGNSPTLPDTNGGYLIGIDSRNNNGDGIRLENTFNNTLLNIYCQVNGGYSVHLVTGAQSNYLEHIISEQGALGEVKIESGSKFNTVKVATGSIIDEGENNLTIERLSSMGNFIPSMKNPFIHQELLISNPNISGSWQFTKNKTNRNLELKLTGTSSSANIDLTSVSGNNSLLVDKTKIGNGTTIVQHMMGLGSRDFGDMPAHSTSEVTLTVPGASVGDGVYVYPAGKPENGLMWSGYVSAPDTVTIRLANVTSALINPLPIAWRCDVWKH